MVGIELYALIVYAIAVCTVSVVDILVIAHNISFFVAAFGDMVAAVLKWSNNRPAVLVEEHFVNSYLMHIAVLETCVIEQIPPSVIVVKNGVVTGSKIR